MARERGFTLLETMICVGLLALLATFGFESLAARPAQSRTAALRFAALVADARALAANTAAGSYGGGGATIGVVRRGDDYIATVYSARPVAGAALQPSAATATTSLHSPAALLLGRDSAATQPPFAIFISPAGHAAAAAGFEVNVSAPLAVQPACPPGGAIALSFGSATARQTYGLSCDYADLNVERPGVDGGTAFEPPSGAPPRLVNVP